jgi:hypothetical protein
MRQAPTLSPVFFLAVAVAMLVAVMPMTARAEDAVAKVTALNRKALEAYSAQEYDTARTLLKQALEVCSASGLDNHPIKARTHIHFGVVAIVGFKQRDAGIKHFRKAIEIEPEIKLTKSLVTPDLQDAFEEAALTGDGAAAPGGGPKADGGGDEAGGDEKPSVQADEGDDEDRPSQRKPKAAPPRKKKVGDGDGEDDGQAGSIFIGFTAGTGFGVASGKGELDPNEHELGGAGFALAQLGHLEPEVGYFLSKDLLLSAALRFQYVNTVNGKPGAGCGPDNFCTPSKTALAVLARAYWFLGDGPFRFMVGGQVGGGNIRHALEFSADDTCKSSASATATQTCVDTLASGPFLIGPMAGFFYELGSSLNLIVNVNTQLGVPKFTFNVDINAGIGLRI